MRSTTNKRQDALSIIARLLFPAALLTASFPGHAQDQVNIDGDAVTGTATVNAAAGDNNQQINAGVISQGAGALSTGAASQHNANPAADSAGGSAAIAAGAFAGSSGWIAVNGASGNDNQQANMAAFAFGIEAGAVADNLLSQTRASTEPTGAAKARAADPEHAVAIGEGAFENSSGLVQVSLVGGDRNTSANTFALSVSGSAAP